MSCRSCDQGHPIMVLDEDGTLSAVSGKVGEPCHSADDGWWPCTTDFLSFVSLCVLRGKSSEDRGQRRGRRGGTRMMSAE